MRNRYALLVLISALLTGACSEQPPVVDTKGDPIKINRDLGDNALTPVITCRVETGPDKTVVTTEASGGITTKTTVQRHICTNRIGNHVYVDMTTKEFTDVFGAK